MPIYMYKLPGLDYLFSQCLAPPAHVYIVHRDVVNNFYGRYSWFSVDVISLCKLDFRHVDAHVRCEIVSNCKQIWALFNRAQVHMAVLSSLSVFASWPNLAR